jgi:hypothetical protein
MREESYKENIQIQTKSHHQVQPKNVVQFKSPYQQMDIRTSSSGKMTGSWLRVGPFILTRDDNNHEMVNRLKAQLPLTKHTMLFIKSSTLAKLCHHVGCWEHKKMAGFIIRLQKYISSGRFSASICKEVLCLKPQTSNEKTRVCLNSSTMTHHSDLPSEPYR